MAFSLFGKKEKATLGIDVGAGGVKIAELTEAKGRPQLRSYAFTDRPSNTDQALIDDPKALADLVKKMLTAGKMSGRRMIAGLPVASVFSSTLSVPQTSGKELKDAIEWQAKKLIPLPLEEMVLDWKFIGEEKIDKKAKQALPAATRGLLTPLEVKSTIPGLREAKREGPPELGKKTMRVLLTGAAKVLVNKYVEFAKAAGLEFASLETEAFALIRSLIGKDPSTIMIIDFGTVRTSLVVVEKGLPVLTRTIVLGGLTVTRAIARTLGIPEDQAEQLKRDIEKLEALGSGGGMPLLLAKTLEPLVTEVRYSINLHKTQQAESEGARALEKIILTGGGAHLPYLAPHLSRELNVNTFVGDPWARVATHEDLRPVLDEIGPRFAVSIGLAMRDFE